MESLSYLIAKAIDEQNEGYFFYQKKQNSTLFIPEDVNNIELIKQEDNKLTDSL